MVTRFGMSDVIGPLQLNSGDSNPFLGLELGQQRSYSEDVARKIDAEVRRIVSEAYDRARTVLKARQAQLVQVAEALLEKEVLERKEFLRILEAGLAAPETAMASAD
jgi:cell division protease FtsH